MIREIKLSPIHKRTTTQVWRSAERHSNDSLTFQATCLLECPVSLYYDSHTLSHSSRQHLTQVSHVPVVCVGRCLITRITLNHGNTWRLVTWELMTINCLPLTDAVCVCVCVCVLVTQLCPTLIDPMDHRPPDSSVHGILQARIQEWVAIPFCRGSSPPRDRTWIVCIAGRFFTNWATGKPITDPIIFKRNMPGLVLCEDLDGWEEGRGGRLKREEVCT